jgi:hypothetical protein
MHLWGRGSCFEKIVAVMRCWLHISFKVGCMSGWSANMFSKALYSFNEVFITIFSNTFSSLTTILIIINSRPSLRTKKGHTQKSNKNPFYHV